MECWNGTCGISQMPIRRGKRVVLFPLNGGGFSNSNDICSPIFIPVKGEYNEYGRIINRIKMKLLLFIKF